MASVQQNLQMVAGQTRPAGERSPALVAKGSIATNATLEETASLPTILGKPTLLKSFAVSSTGSGVEGGVKQVTGLVAHRPDVGVQVGLLVLQEVPGLIDGEACEVPGHRVHLLLHHRPVLDAGVLVKAACDNLPETGFSLLIILKTNKRYR